MCKRVCGLLLVLVTFGWQPLVGSAAAPPAIRGAAALLPAGPAPFQALAKAGRDGGLDMRVLEAAYRIEEVTDPKTGKPAHYAYVVYTLGNRCFKREDFQAYNVKGKEIDSSSLRKLLREEARVLVSSDGKLVDPLHLSMVKGSSVVLVIPKLVWPAND